MAYFSGIGLKVKGYKSFSGDDFQGIDDIKHVNVLIGKNNSGKTAFLEFVRSFFDLAAESPRGNDMPFSARLTRVPSKELDSNGDSPTKAWHKVLQKREWESYPRINATAIKSSNSTNSDHNKEGFVWGENIHSTVQHQDIYLHRNIGLELLRQVDTFRIAAERDIRPELVHSRLPIAGNGEGITQFINRVLNDSRFLERSYVDTIRTGINDILRPEISIDDFYIRDKAPDKDKNILRAIFMLESQSSTQVELSSMGSGLKTILQVVIGLHFCQWKQQDFKPDKDASKTFFLFEELENNLHPRIFRRLLAYIRDFSHAHDCPIFLTTHSPIAIDFFQHDPKAQIIHVWRDGLVSKMKTVEGLNEKHGILDALGVKASDLLQSNAVIWVEGPSDRIYINRWIELMSEGKLEEGIHYQCVFYGGRLASHLGFGEEEENPDDLKKMIDLLKVNRKPVFVTDSDRREAGARINDTKKRIQEEIETVERLFWLTEGREIENYLPKSLIQKIAEKQSDHEFAQYESIGDYLKRIEDTKWVKKNAPELKNKIDFALAAIEVMTMEDIDNAPWGLKSSLEALVKFIEGANQ